jgi:protein-disulfide isomerase
MRAWRAAKRRMVNGLLFVLPTGLLMAASSTVSAQTCPALTPQLSAKLAAYVAAKYQIAPDITVEDKGTVGSTCFRQVEFQAESPKRNMYLYLSPDQHYLTPDLLDITGDLRAERERVAKQTERELLAEQSPARGGDTPHVTIVEFSDLQCPACKRFEDMLTAARIKNKEVRDEVRVVYKHRPLPIHNWARRAAEVSICASFQSELAFWDVHDFFYNKQDTISSDNFDDRLTSFLNGDSKINATQLHSCIAGHQADALLERDENLADEYGINSTPTVFVNGDRIKGFRSEEDLVRVVDQALASPKHNDRADATPPSNTETGLICSEKRKCN